MAWLAHGLVHARAVLLYSWGVQLRGNSKRWDRRDDKGLDHGGWWPRLGSMDQSQGHCLGVGLALRGPGLQVTISMGMTHVGLIWAALVSGDHRMSWGLWYWRLVLVACSSEAGPYAVVVGRSHRVHPAGQHKVGYQSHRWDSRRSSSAV